MNHPRPAAEIGPAWSVFPELAPIEEVERKRARSLFRLVRTDRAEPVPAQEFRPALGLRDGKGHLKASTLSFSNISQHGDLFVSFMRARKKIFIDRLNWKLPETEGMEFDQYDTPLCRWIAIYEFGEVLGGIRLTPTTASCGLYSYMLRDAQKGILENIPTDVLFIEAPVDKNIWEASRLFIADSVPAHRRLRVQALLMERMREAARELGAQHVIGIVPSVWSRWLRRLQLDAVPVGPKFKIDGTVTQAALFNVNQRDAAIP